jgi:hypothetical protein
MRGSPIQARYRLAASVALAVGISLGVAAPRARADHMNDKLIEEAPKVLKALRAHGYHNVGVLRFRVQQGSRPESFGAGLLSGNMATRLENALVMHLGSDEKDAVGVIHDASKTAAAHKVGNWYADPAERKKLFGISDYPLAWGSKRVRADAFLTGLVKISADYEKTSVVIQAFSAQAPAKVEKVAEFEFATDVSVLLDLGKSYSIAQRGHVSKGGAYLRTLVFQAVRRRDGDTSVPVYPPPEPPPPAATGTGNTAVPVGDIEFQLMSGADPVEIKQDSFAEKQIVCPDPDKPVTIRITNKGTAKVGVDVRINGVSVLLEQTTPAPASRVWVVPPGQAYTLKGYYLTETGEKNVAPFKVFIGQEAQTLREQLAARPEVADKVGLIQISVFAESTGADLLVSDRNLKPRVEPAARNSLDTLQRALMRSAKLIRRVETVKEGGRVYKRELIDKDQAEEKKSTEALKAVEFQRTSVPTAEVTIRVVPKVGPTS